VLASGLTIAGATLCLHFTRLPYFQSMGVPLSVGMVLVVAAALTLGPALISVCSRFGRVLEPRRVVRSKGWRRVGTATVRWPGAILVCAIAVSLVGLLTLPGYHTTTTTASTCPMTYRRMSATRPRTGISPGQDEPGPDDGRDRSRSAESGRLPGHRQDRQGSGAAVTRIAQVQTIPGPTANRSNIRRFPTRSARAASARS